ncbi:3-dehydroquinate dehydratase [Enterocloster clostridioformis]|uniref:type I 3-dehydroquinate dehydratase n=1 Tax=Enterocloster clostridioformis TaxID=1531 RepID=UPI00080CA808|nr:type I 3-dehydroquinate dehydratase [Enterocloster clostridioformis]ANU50735.1 3-dehydroquinate dehydratase [Lachnoclostridium sp. YL32]NDO28562.1 type I 3-dehydroquinate dehydratase [Enterocloster clostridioformis]OXE71438.1 3-dehydroquinate dehydratase [Enterocloster clostridioformis]QQR01146.1 type I 3-dehydroquinate dehydratase [Enterocloster clostridioformis]
MKNVIIKQTVLGQGMPKICAPLVEKDYESLINQAESFTEQPVDVAEWRADWFDSILEPDILDQVLPGLESALKDIPLLFTFRTQREGGHVPAPLPAYRSLVEQAICSGHVHLVDLELFSGDDMVRETVELARRHQVRVILSNHDFAATPKEDDILRRLHHMEELGADIAKIAVMPRSARDVLTLLSATDKASQSLSCPVVTMSMKGTGLISRLSGEVFGSCLTFGSVKEASAPGQIEAGKLKDILTAIHENL